MQSIVLISFQVKIKEYAVFLYLYFLQKKAVRLAIRINNLFVRSPDIYVLSTYRAHL
jgi:hypothetical protein